jgi:hypothetical protein
LILALPITEHADIKTPFSASCVLGKESSVKNVRHIQWAAVMAIDEHLLAGENAALTREKPFKRVKRTCARAL